MLTPHHRKERTVFDPFTPSEYYSLIRIIRLYGRFQPHPVTVNNNSFTVEKDLVIDKHLSLQGVFDSPLEIRKSTVVMKILKDSFFFDGALPSGKISAEFSCTMELEKRTPGEHFPGLIHCRMHSSAVYTEKAETGLISRRKVYIEKTFRHSTTAGEVLPGLPPASSVNCMVKGCFKIDASTGHIMEEVYE